MLGFGKVLRIYTCGSVECQSRQMAVLFIREDRLHVNTTALALAGYSSGLEQVRPR